MTPKGRSYVVNRLLSCPDLATLRKVWGQLGVEPKNDAEIIALKDRLKEGFDGSRNTNAHGRIV